MAWTTQYYHEWKSRTGGSCRLDFKEDAVAANTLIQGQVSPIRFRIPRIQDRLQPVRGKGADIYLVNETDRQLQDLADATMHQVRVEYRLDSTLVWFGWLDHNQTYLEDFTQYSNYDVQFTASDGLGILDKIKFLDSGSPYTGMKSKWELLEIILTKWGLLDLVTNIKVKLATTSTDISITGDDNLLHESYASCHNWYDEDGQPASCRQVLEDILRPYGAFITMIGTDVCIIDLHTLATNSSFTWQVYTTGSGFPADSPATAASDSIQEIETLGYYQSRGQLQHAPLTNRQVIRYSRYTPDSLEDNLQQEAEYTPAPSFSLQSVYTTTWYEADNMTGLTDWTPTGAGWIGYKQDLYDPPEYMIRINNPNFGVGTVLYTYYPEINMLYDGWTAPYIIGNAKYYLKITMQLRFMTRTNPYEQGSETDNAAFQRAGILFRVRIDDQVFGFPTTSQQWHTKGSPYQADDQILIMVGENSGNAKNKWLPAHVYFGASSQVATQALPEKDDAIYIALEDDLNGPLEMEFTRQIYAYNDDDLDEDQIKLIEEVHIRDIKVELVTNPGMQPATFDDLEYIGEVDQGYLDDGDPVTLNLGCSADYGTPWDNGAICYDDSGTYRHVTEWTRAGETDTIERLLLNTVQSNREVKTVRLQGLALNNVTHLPFLRIKDSTHLSGKMLMLAGGVLDPAMDSLDCDLVEIIADNMTIA